MSDFINQDDEVRISRATSPVTIVTINWVCATAHAEINRKKLERAKKRRKISSK